MTLFCRFVLIAASVSATFALNACQPKADSEISADADQATEQTAPNTSPDEAASAEGYIDDNISASDMVADNAPTTNMLKDYNKSVTRMYDESTIGMGYNDPDTAFAKSMLGHHRGAIDLATLELKYGSDATMRKLAQQIIDKQQVELAIMNKWLASHLDSANPKLETPFVQQAYKDSTQPMYDEMLVGIADPIPDMAFARSILAHHVGAIDMAMIELKYGTDEEMLALARAIIAAQQPEIEQIRNWLSTRSTEANNDMPPSDTYITDSSQNELLKKDDTTAKEPIV